MRRRVLRWKRDGARQTARLVGVIWFSDTLAVTSLSRHSSVRRASRFSSGSSSTAARAACRRSSLGMSVEEEGGCQDFFFNIISRKRLITTGMLHDVIFFGVFGKSVCMASLRLPGLSYDEICVDPSVLYKSVYTMCFMLHAQDRFCFTLYKQILMQLLQSYRNRT